MAKKWQKTNLKGESMKYGTNSGLIMLKKDNGIIIDSTSSYLKKVVKTSDDELTWQLLVCLKKPHELNEIASKLNLNIDETKNIIDTLLIKKLIVQNPLTENDKFFRVDRFVNSLPDITYLEYKKNIDKVTIMILGVGTAGSYAIEFLSKLGFTNFIIIDSDIVEYKNIVSQNYTVNDIDLLKVEVLKKKYSDCNIIAINKKITSYDDLNILINKYNPQYLLSNADDANLVINILNNVFNDHEEIKILESGYNVSEVQFELIDKNNYTFLLEKFIEMRDYFIVNNEFNGIVDNSGMIFQSFISAFFSSKFIFDDMTNLPNADWGRFNLLENKYFFDNRFYWSDFGNYIFRYRKDNNLELQRVNTIETDQSLDANIKLFLASNTNKKAFEFLKNLNLNVTDNQNISVNNLKTLLISYGHSQFNSKIIDSKHIIDNNIALFAKGNNLTEVNYAEPINVYENRIFIGSQGTDAIINFIHETFHTLLFGITQDTYKHEEFVLKNMLNFCIYLKNEKSKYFQYVASLMINYIQGYYLDDFMIVNKEKSDLLGESMIFYNSLDYDSMKQKNRMDLDSFIEKKSKNKPKFYFLRYTYPVENNLFLLKKVVSSLRREE